MKRRGFLGALLALVGVKLAAERAADCTCDPRSIILCERCAERQWQDYCRAVRREMLTAPRDVLTEARFRAGLGM